MQIEHWLDDPALSVAEILQVYSYRVCHGHCSKLPEVRSDSVSEVWQPIASVHLLDGRPDLQKPRGASSRDLNLRLIRQLHTYSFQDPSTSRQKPAPLGLVVAAARNTSSSPKDWCLAYLVQIGLYFCLRSCDYTKTNSYRRTTQFLLRDIQFQDSHGTISFDTLDSCFLNALVVTTHRKILSGEIQFSWRTPI